MALIVVVVGDDLNVTVAVSVIVDPSSTPEIVASPELVAEVKVAAYVPSLLSTTELREPDEVERVTVYPPPAMALS